MICNQLYSFDKDLQSTEKFEFELLSNLVLWNVLTFDDTNPCLFTTLLQQYEVIRHHTQLAVQEYYGAKGVDDWNVEKWKTETDDNDVSCSLSWFSALKCVCAEMIV